LLVWTALYLGHGIRACHHAAPRVSDAWAVTGSERAYQELAAMSGETMAVGEVQVSLHVEPAFRQASRDERPRAEVGRVTAGTPRDCFMRWFYLRAWAARQDTGYYVFSLREIIV
jgi:hypothetical protein